MAETVELKMTVLVEMAKSRDLHTVTFYPAQKGIVKSDIWGTSQSATPSHRVVL